MDKGSGVTCSCLAILLLFNLIIGGWSVNYLLLIWAGKTIPFIGAAIIGTFVGEISIPAAIIVLVLKWGGIL